MNDKKFKAKINNRGAQGVGLSKRCLLLFSGGLDSILAAKILEKQGIEVTALTFVSYFFDADQAEKSAKENGIKLRIENFSDAHLKIVKNPHFSRGAGMNPCVDCHLLMLKAAKKIAARGKYDFIATGEVLGQRPMSQNIEALKLIEREAGLQGKIIRPLSEKILHPESEISKGMYGISGRSRKEQMVLARKYKIKKYPSPAGGCILADREYSKKLLDLLKNVKNPEVSDFELLRIGRHFWSEETRIILGRNHEENLKLEKLSENADILIGPENVPGPTALVRGKRSKSVLSIAKKLILRYTKKTGESPSFKISTK